MLYLCQIHMMLFHILEASKNFRIPFEQFLTVYCSIPLTMELENLFIMLLLLVIYDAEPRYFRRKAKARMPLIMNAMNDAQDFYQLTHLDLSVFQRELVEPVKFVLEKTNVYQVYQYLIGLLILYWCSFGIVLVVN